MRSSETLQFYEYVLENWPHTSSPLTLWLDPERCRDPGPEEAADEDHRDGEDDLGHGHGHDVAVAHRGHRGDGPVEGVQIPWKLVSPACN